MTINFSAGGGVDVVKGRQKESRAIYVVTLAKQSTEGKEITPEVMEVRNEDKDSTSKPTEALKSFPLS